jgi:hypothetical protein
MTSSDWRSLLDGLSRESRIKALLSYELAADRADGQSLEMAIATLRAVAAAEGLDPDDAWITEAAAQIARGRTGATVRPPLPA